MDERFSLSVTDAMVGFSNPETGILYNSLPCSLFSKEMDHFLHLLSYHTLIPLISKFEPPEMLA